MELQESLAEEAALEAAVAHKRSLAVLQASRIAQLERSTAELLRRRDEGAALAAEAPPARRPEAEAWKGCGSDSPTAPSEMMAIAGACMAAGDPVEETGPEADGAVSLEAAAVQLCHLGELKKQVGCLEEEMLARTAEVERLTALLTAFDFLEQQQQQQQQQHSGCVQAASAAIAA